MERTLRDLNQKIHRTHKKNLIEKDQANEELRLRHVTGDWTKTREELFYPSRCKSVPLPRVARDPNPLDALPPLPVTLSLGLKGCAKVDVAVLVEFREKYLAKHVLM